MGNREWEKNSNVVEKEMKDIDYLRMMSETSDLCADQNANNLGSSLGAYKTSEDLSNNVEFWKWLSRNYSGSGIFDNTGSMQQYIARGEGKEEWVLKQLQGKGYEWDWMVKQRQSIANVFKQYDAGDVVNRAASDVTERDIISGTAKEYQMKAYTSKTNPNLKNTPKDMTIVTNAEKVDVVKGNGYKDVESYRNNNEIKNVTNERMKQIKDGTASTAYGLKNVGCTMAKAGLIGCAIGITTETVIQYKNWKRGEIGNEEYVDRVLKSGANAGLTGGITAGIMVPIQTAVTAAGVSCPVLIPISIVIGVAVDKVVAPCFGRGDYAKILGEARYYRNLEVMYNDLMEVMYTSATDYFQYIDSMKMQFKKNSELTMKGQLIDQRLSDLYNKI